jgi:hypothetical protein
MRLGWLFILCLPQIAMGQGFCNSGTALRLGETKIAFTSVVRISTRSSERGRIGKPLCGDAVPQGDRIHRVLYDAENRPYFGYDLVVHSDTAGKSFRIEVAGPKGETGSASLRTFSKLPDPVTLADGDRISVPVLQDPKTGAVVIMDSFEIGGAATPVQALPTSGEIPKIPPSGTLLRIEQPELATSFSEFGASPQMGVTGPVVWVYTPRLGRILFSATPRPGFFRTAVASGTRIRFEDGVDAYTLSLHAAPIVEPGAWQLWCKREPGFRPPPGPWTDQELQHGLLAIGLER